MMHSLLQLFVVLFPISEIALGLWRRARGSESGSIHDRGSLRLLWIVIVASTALASGLANYGPTRIHFPTLVIEALALAMIVAGLVLRWTSIMVLGRFFTVDVAIMPGHQLVDRGPYRFVRHPAYSGLLLEFAGLGLYFRNWLSFLVLVVHIGLALVYRIRIEEVALNAAFGPKYAAYCARTKRLVPGVF